MSRHLYRDERLAVFHCFLDLNPASRWSAPDREKRASMRNLKENASSDMDRILGRTGDQRVRPVLDAVEVSVVETRQRTSESSGNVVMMAFSPCFASVA